LPSLAWQACQPRVWRKLVELVRYPQRTEQAQQGQQTLPPAELLSLAVVEDHRRQGLARALYAQLIETFRQQGVASFRILVGGNLATARRFYAAQGATEAATLELHAGEQTIVFEQSLLSGEPNNVSRSDQDGVTHQAR
jgi:GNAT superfamily N-acetyltransferase